MVEHLPYTRECFVCGTDNPNGLNLRFHSSHGEIFAEFTPRPQHAGYPDVLHGGVIGAALDEAMFWAATHSVQRMHMSAEMTIRYRNPVHVGGCYRLVARMVASVRTMCRTEAELLDADGVVCASASGKYLPLPEADAARVRADFRADDDTVSPDRYLCSEPPPTTQTDRDP
jgi:acyl-coenzyme A thioesterase PaaI-like protein